MNTPEFITFTGIDDRTDLTQACKLVDQYPIEWGILFSNNNQDARFPCRQAVEEILCVGRRHSAHICGGYAREMVKGNVKIQAELSAFNRMQINGAKDIAPFVQKDLEDKYRLKIILQARGQFGVNLPYQQLFDCSGGRGQLPNSIPQHPGGNVLAGYAGGMGPDTVLNYLSMINTDGKYWIDMEGRVRHNGWFDLDLVEKVCQKVYG